MLVQFHRSNALHATLFSSIDFKFSIHPDQSSIDRDCKHRSFVRESTLNQRFSFSGTTSHCIHRGITTFVRFTVQISSTIDQSGSSAEKIQIDAKIIVNRFFSRSTVPHRSNFDNKLSSSRIVRNSLSIWSIWSNSPMKLLGKSWWMEMNRDGTSDCIAFHFSLINMDSTALTHSSNPVSNLVTGEVIVERPEHKSSKMKTSLDRWHAYHCNRCSSSRSSATNQYPIDRFE